MHICNFWQVYSFLYSPHTLVECSVVSICCLQYYFNSNKITAIINNNNNDNNDTNCNNISYINFLSCLLTFAKKD